MFKKTSSLIFLSLFGLCLTSCFNGEVVFEEYKNFLDPIQTKFEINAPNYYKLKAYESLKYKDLANTDNELVINSFRDVYSSQNNGRTYLNLMSTGTQNVLVLPVSFKDSDKNNLDEKYACIQNAIFGKESKTVHESVASYYNEVSFGQLKISGEVAPFYHLDLSSNDLEKESSGSETAVAKYVTTLAYSNWLETNQDKVELFDQDHDNFIDAVITIYDFPYSYEDGSLYWAFVDHMKRNENYGNKKINNESVALSTYGWMSYDFLNVEHGVVDAHVYIHEFGHILGLQDYYSKNDYQPLGFMDMMDYNLGDHNAFSKMLLNWTTPYVITGPGEIKIKPSYNSGDCILIPCKEWNKTPYDEFILLEFYAPEGVNYYDTRLSFKYNDNQDQPKKGNLFTNYGIKVYHVDSRIGYMENKLIYGAPIALIGDPNIDNIAKEYQKECLDKGYGYTKYCIDFPFTNALSNHPYIKLIEAKENNTLLSYNAATNDTLFQVGDNMGISDYMDYKFYDGEELPFNFIVKEITPRGAVISFSN